VGSSLGTSAVMCLLYSFSISRHDRFVLLKNTVSPFAKKDNTNKNNAIKTFSNKSDKVTLPKLNVTEGSLLSHKTCVFKEQVTLVLNTFGVFK
jgi:hypothetical protein